MKQLPKKKIKYKIRYKNILIFLLIVYVLYFIITTALNKKITNIYITGNIYLSDWQIIEIASLSSYPSTLLNTCNKIEKSLEENIYIKSAKVYKKNLTEVYIEVEDNYPLFYYSNINKTILYNFKEIDGNLNTMTIINYIPDLVYEEFKEKMQTLNFNIIKKVSEIKYDPNEVDDKRFLFTMNDGNYVYITLDRFDSLNRYIDIVKSIGDKSGILYLDSGEYFEIK